MKRKTKVLTRKKRLFWKMKHPFLVLGGALLCFLTLWLFFWHRFYIAHSKPVPAEGGMYTEATIGKIKNLSPLAHKTSLFDRDIHQLVFAGLLQYNPTTKQIESALAEFKLLVAMSLLSCDKFGFLLGKTKPLLAS